MLGVIAIAIQLFALAGGGGSGGAAESFAGSFSRNALVVLKY